MESVEHDEESVTSADLSNTDSGRGTVEDGECVEMGRAGPPRPLRPVRSKSIRICLTARFRMLSTLLL